MSARLQVSKVRLSAACLADVRRACGDLSESAASERVGAWLQRLLDDRDGALNPKTTAARRDAALDAAFGSGLNSGFLRIYDGTQPTDADTALGAQVKLAELTLNATAFAAASAGSKAANAITADSSADATGTATWGTLTTSAGTRYMDFSVGTSGANLNLNSVAISSGANVSVSSFTVTQAA
jgi:hypothetical protein